jgi:hypothetical protein
MTSQSPDLPYVTTKPKRKRVQLLRRSTTLFATPYEVWLKVPFTADELGKENPVLVVATIDEPIIEEMGYYVWHLETKENPFDEPIVLHLCCPVATVEGAVKELARSVLLTYEASKNETWAFDPERQHYTKADYVLPRLRDFCNYTMESLDQYLRATDSDD